MFAIPDGKGEWRHDDAKRLIEFSDQLFLNGVMGLEFAKAGLSFGAAFFSSFFI